MAGRVSISLALICLMAATLACGGGGGAQSSAANTSVPAGGGSAAPNLASTSSSSSTSTPATNPAPSTAPPAPTTVAPNATVYRNIEDMANWNPCTAFCSGGNGSAVFSMIQDLATPALDGSSAEFSYGGGPAFSSALWSEYLAGDGTSTNFLLDLYYYVDQPADPQALEFAANQQLADGWYKFSTQCAFADGVWRVWDSQNGGWVATTAPCTRPPADTWQHLTLQYQRANGQAVFVSITVNGQTYSINQAFNPQAQPGTGSVGVHFAMVGDALSAPYNVWIDEMSLSTW